MIHAFTLIIILFSFLIAISFGIKNDQQITVNIFTYNIKTNITRLILISFLSGFIVSWIISFIYILIVKAKNLWQKYKLKKNHEK